MILLIIAAFTSGFLASLGVGGGMILILFLTAVLNYSQFEAQGINLLFFIPIALFSVLVYKKDGSIDVKKLYPAIAAGIISAISGVLLAAVLGSLLLKKIFALAAAYIGINEIMTGFGIKLKRASA